MKSRKCQALGKMARPFVLYILYRAVHAFVRLDPLRVHGEGVRVQNSFFFADQPVRSAFLRKLPSKTQYNST